MRVGTSIALGTWTNALANIRQNALLRDLGGQLTLLNAVQTESLDVQQRLLAAQEVQHKQLEGIALTQQEMLALQRQQLDLQLKDRTEREWKRSRKGAAYAVHRISGASR